MATWEIVKTGIMRYEYKSEYGTVLRNYKKSTYRAITPNGTLIGTRYQSKDSAQRALETRKVS